MIVEEDQHAFYGRDDVVQRLHEVLTKTVDFILTDQLMIKFVGLGMLHLVDS